MYVKLLHLYLSISQVILMARCFIKDPENKKNAIALNYPSSTHAETFKINLLYHASYK